MAFWETDPAFDIARHVVREHACRRRADARELQDACLAPRHDAARSGAPDVAVPPGRPLRRRQRAHRAHSPLLRRRHRARARDALDDRRVARWAAGDAVRPARTGARARRRRRAGAAARTVVGRARAPRASSARRSSRRATDLWSDPAKAVALADAGRRLHRGNREARADAAGFADALQGQARRAQASVVDRSAAAGGSEDDRPGARRLGQRRAAVVRRRARCAAISRTRATTSTT